VRNSSPRANFAKSVNPSVLLPVTHLCDSNTKPYLTLAAKKSRKCWAVTLNSSIRIYLPTIPKRKSDCHVIYRAYTLICTVCLSSDVQMESDIHLRFLFIFLLIYGWRIKRVHSFCCLEVQEKFVYLNRCIAEGANSNT
jgi:hypothetical protein